MNDLPKDPVMLLSVINTKLRDEFSSLDELCKAHGVAVDEISKALERIDYHYDESTNQFV